MHCGFRRCLFAACCISLFGEMMAHAFTTVVIDAGHGGGDPGSSWNGLVEKTLCLDTAKRVETLLKAKGFNTVMTRSTDVYVELAERANIANRHSNAIFVSIHYDASRDKSAHGYETHHHSPKGKLLGESIQAAVRKEIGGRDRGTKYQDLKVLRETKCTAVLVECGFISNQGDASNCGSAAHRQKIANGIAEGIAAMKDKL